MAYQIPKLPTDTPELDKLRLTRPALRPQEEELSEAGKGARAFVDETQALGGGLVALGAQGVKKFAPDAALPALDSASEWGMDVYQRNMEEATAGRQAPKVADLRDIKSIGDFGNWAAYQGTKGLGTLATIALSGGVTGAVAKAGLKEGAKRALRAKTAQQLAKVGATAAQRQAAAATVNFARAAGASAGAFGLEAGSAFGQNVQEGVRPEDAVLPAITVGAINAALELTPFGIAAKYLKLDKDVFSLGIRNAIKGDTKLLEKAKSLAHVAKSAGKAAGAGVLTEGLTEGVQELVQMAGERWAKDENVFGKLSDDQLWQVANAAAAGGLIGGGVGGVVGGTRGAVERNEAQKIYAGLKAQQQKKDETEKKAETEAAPEAGPTPPAGPVGPTPPTLPETFPGQPVPLTPAQLEVGVEGAPQQPLGPGAEVAVGPAITGPEVEQQRKDANAAALERLKQAAAEGRIGNIPPHPVTGTVLPTPEEVKAAAETQATLPAAPEEVLGVSTEAGLGEAAPLGTYTPSAFIAERGITRPPDNFVPTHEAPDGTPLMATEEPDMYVDATGGLVTETYATPVVEETEDGLRMQGQEVGGPEAPAGVGEAAPGVVAPPAGVVEETTGVGEPTPIAEGVTATQPPVAPPDVSNLVPEETPDAQQDQEATQPDGDVQQPAGPQEGEGQVPAAEGGEGVPVRGQEEEAEGVVAPKPRETYADVLARETVEAKKRYEDLRTKKREDEKKASTSPPVTLDLDLSKLNIPGFTPQEKPQFITRSYRSDTVRSKSGGNFRSERGAKQALTRRINAGELKTGPNIEYNIKNNGDDNWFIEVEETRTTELPGKEYMESATGTRKEKALNAKRSIWSLRQGLARKRH